MWTRPTAGPALPASGLLSFEGLAHRTVSPLRRLVSLCGSFGFTWRRTNPSSRGTCALHFEPCALLPVLMSVLDCLSPRSLFCADIQHPLLLPPCLSPCIGSAGADRARSSRYCTLAVGPRFALLSWILWSPRNHYASFGFCSLRRISCFTSFLQPLTPCCDGVLHIVFCRILDSSLHPHSADMSSPIEQHCSSDGLPILGPELSVPAMVKVSRPAPICCLDAFHLWFVDFLRSFLALQLLAFARLVLYALPQQPRCERINRGLHVGRVSLRGAPLCLCFALCCVTAIGAPIGPGGVPEPSASARSQGDVSGASASAAAGSFFSCGTRPSHILPAVDAPLRNPPERPDYGLSEFESDGESDVERFWSFPIKVLQYQRPALLMPMPINGFRGPLDLLSKAEASLQAERLSCRFLAVEPQPSADHLVLLSEPTAAEQMFVVPVCFQLQAGEDMLRVWMDLLDPDITYAGLRDTLAQDWPDGARVYVGSSAYCLAEHTSAKLLPGTLIRVLAPGRPLRTVASFAAKLQNYDYHLCDISVQGFPVEQFRSHRYGLVQPLCEPRTVDFSPTAGMTHLDSVVNSHADQGFGPTFLSWPAEPFPCHTIRGRPVDRTAAAFPEACTARCLLFVDGRAIGTPLQVYASPSGWILLPDLFRSIGLTVPWLERLRVSGTVLFTVDRRSVCIRPADVLVLRYAWEGEPMATVISLCSSDSDCDLGGPPDGATRPASHRAMSVLCHSSGFQGLCRWPAFPFACSPCALFR